MSVIFTRATLKLAGREDVFHNNETFENKLLFLKCPLKHEFIGMYTIPAIDNNEYPYMEASQRQTIKAINKYSIEELNVYLKNYALYKLSDTTNSMDFQFKLYLRPANDFDLYDSTIFQKPNIICYVKTGDAVVGPYSLNDLENVKEKMNKAQIYIPTKKQLFEPYNISKAS